MSLHASVRAALRDNVVKMAQNAGNHRDRWLALAYVSSALLTCVLVETAPTSLTYRLAKVSPLLLLSAARFSEARDRAAQWVGLGLVASFVGDAVIDSSFVAGLASFLVGHVFYIVAMAWPRRTMGTALWSIPALFLAGTTHSILVASERAPEALRIPVTLYILVISTMFGRATARAFSEVRDRASRIFLAGAFFFVISDSLIGIRRWVVPIPHGAVLVLATYFLGQWGIYWGSRAPARP